MRAIVHAGLALLLLALASPARCAPDDQAAIRQLIDSFRSAIVERDKPRFLGLFLHENVTWQAVTEDASLARVRLEQPDAAKTGFDAKNTPVAFADAFVKDPKGLDESFDNIRIDTDGDVASVAMDYVFLRDGRERNRGREHWLLVRAENGWKIAGVAWSKVLPKP